MLSELSERFSAGAGAGAAVSSFFALGAVFFFGSAGAATAASTLAGSPWTSAASGFGAASFAALGALGLLAASSAGFLVQPLNFPCFRVFVADDPDGFARTFP